MTQLLKTECPSLASSALSKPNPPRVLKWSYWPKFKFWKLPQAEFNFLESQASLAALIQARGHQTYDKRTFRGVAHWHFLINGLRPQKCQSLGFHSEYRAAKLLPTWQLMDCLLNLKRLNALTAPHTPVSPRLVIYSQRNLSQGSTFRVWTWIYGPFQDWNLKDR
jgi:hypothetical protein